MPMKTSEAIDVMKSAWPNLVAMVERTRLTEADMASWDRSRQKSSVSVERFSKDFHYVVVSNPEFDEMSLFGFETEKATRKFIADECAFEETTVFKDDVDVTAQLVPAEAEETVDDEDVEDDNGEGSETTE